MSVIDVRELSVTIGKDAILSDISFKSESGSITGLLGPSGAGKTTLMRALVGLQNPSKGVISILGNNAGSPKLRSKIGYMTQNLSIYSDLTVMENLNYFSAVTGASKKSVAKVINRLSLDGLENHLVSTTSGGQKTRVSLAAALLGEPELLVLDEPTVGIDPLLRAEIWKFLNEIAANGTTLIVSSHVMDEAAHCNNLILLRDGKVLANDTPSELKRRTGCDNIESAFLHLVKDNK